MLSDKTHTTFNSSEDTRKHILLVISTIAIATLAISLRSFDLEGKSLWCDELASIRRAEGSVTNLIKDLLELEHVPLYELSLHFWLELGRSDFFIRCLSSLAGILAVGVSYLFAKELFGRSVGLLTVFLMAVSPHHVLWSRIARPYSFLSLLTLLSCYLFVRALRERKAYLYIAYVDFTLLSLYTHYFSCFVVLAQNLFFVAWWFNIRHSESSSRASTAMKDWILSQSTIGCMFAPWLIMNLTKAVSASVEQQYYASQAGLLVKFPYFFLVFSLGSTVHPLNVPVIVPALIVFSVVFVIGTWRIIRTPDVMPKFIIALLFLPLTLGLFVPACAPKHAISVLPAYIIIIAVGVLPKHTLDSDSNKSSIAKTLPCLYESWKSVFLIAVILILQCVSLKNYFTNQQFTDADMVIPWRSISEFVGDNIRKGDCIVIGYDPEHLYWYYRGGIYWKDAGGAGLYNLDNENMTEQLNNISEEHSRIWFILHTEDPREKVEQWMRSHGHITMEKSYLLEEHTLKGLKEGLRNIHKYRSYMCKVYLFEKDNSS